MKWKTFYRIRENPRLCKIRQRFKRNSIKSMDLINIYRKKTKKQKRKKRIFKKLKRKEINFFTPIFQTLISNVLISCLGISVIIAECVKNLIIFIIALVSSLLGIIVPILSNKYGLVAILALVVFMSFIYSKVK